MPLRSESESPDSDSSHSWRDGWRIAVVVLVAGFGASLYLYHKDAFALLYYGDSVSHSVAARKLFDWTNPGLQQLGTVWLPLPHFILLPFVVSKFLFVSGFSGALVGVTSLACASALLYNMLRKSFPGAGKFLAAAGVLLFALNPNVMYLALTPMSEGPFLLFFTCAAYSFQRWRSRPDSFNYLAWCSLFTALLTLTRYEGWFIPPFLFGLAVIDAAAERTPLRKRLLMIGASVCSGLGLLLWILYNGLRYGNFFEFAGAKYYSAAVQMMGRADVAPLYHHPLRVLSFYLLMAERIFGKPLLAVALLGLVAVAMKKRHDRMSLALFLLLPPLFTMTALFLGTAGMSEWLNSRYLILLAAALSYLCVSLLEAVAETPFRFAPILAFAFAAGVMWFPFSRPFFADVTTFNEGRNGFNYRQNPSAVQTGLALKNAYDGGGIVILTGSAQEHRIMITSGIDLKEFDELIASSEGKVAYERPWLTGKWVVIGKEPDSDARDPADHWLKKKGELLEHYSLFYQNQYYEVLCLAPNRIVR